MAKRSFILFHDYKEQFLCLSDEECGQLIKAIFIYETEGEQTALPAEARMAFRFIRHALDENRGKYEDICKKRREAGKKGGKASVLSKCYQMQPSASDTETKTETETKTDTDTGTETGTETVTGTVQPVGAEKTAESTHSLKKTARGEFSNVFLTAVEMSQLIIDYGAETAMEAVDLLSTRIARDNNSKYKDENHYATIKSWVIDAVKEQQIRQKELSKKAEQAQKKNFISGFEDLEFEDLFEKP